jgi:hypothetical protein
VTEHGKYLDRIEPLAQQFTPEGFHSQRKAFGQSEAAEAVETAEQLASARVAQAEADYAAKLKELSPQGDTAAELRNQRTLARVERQLASADPNTKAETARKLIAEADRDQLGVLVSELPSFGVPSAVVEAAAQAVPELADAATKITKARQSESLIRNDARRIRDAVNDGRRLAVQPVSPAKYDPDRV